MKTNKTCPNCGKPLAKGALEGLCPECMLKVGAVADSVPEQLVGPGGTVVASSPDATPLVSPQIGQEFGRYRILRRLGHGGMGVVYEAEEVESGRRVALKVINQKLNSPADRARFLREGRLAASINHPNCVYVFGTEEIEGTPVIATEFVAGGTLQQRLSQQGPLPVGRAVDAILQIMEGLEAAQAVGILHRDVKPANCFEDATGSVKIGDFGLSISTLPREDTNITESGSMVGTPAFCSPEQHRGEELDARTDMYAVGVTLYYLLTGKLPFEGQTMPQLIANTLEKRAPSPRLHRRQIPDGLARTILRCLSKHPSERFKTYADLRRALEPYSSTAPNPATLGLRFLAGATDLLLLGLAGQVAMFLTVGDPFTVLESFTESPGQGYLMVLPCFAVMILYYGIAEWRWGATVGKALCRLRVLQTDRNYPGLLQALLRAVLFCIVPVLPYWLIAGTDPMAFVEASGRTYALSFSYYVLLGLLFVTARRRNGFASIHDLASRTRVVSRTAMAQRQSVSVGDLETAGVESCPRVGPYHVLQSLGKSGEAEWREGYDLRLLRRVLIRIVPPDTPPLPAAIRHVSRVGRLRWLTGRHDGGENWDAFEGVGGQSLWKLVERPQPWRQVRFWLQDIAEELSAVAREGSPLPVLALNRVWITREGRAKLLDFPAPGLAVETGQTNPGQPPPAEAAALARGFIEQVAATALGGRTSNVQSGVSVPGILPLHARRFLETLPTLGDAEAIAAAIKPLLRRAAEVTRWRRLMIVTGCVAFPVIMSVCTVVGLSLMQSWQQKSPELMELSQVMGPWRAKQMPFVPKDKLPSDRLTGVYIAAHYGHVITNETLWSSGLARVFIPPNARAFAEQSLEQHSSPTAEELAEAETRLGRIAKQSSSERIPPRLLLLPFLLWFMLLVYVCLPAVIAALLFRGGLVLLATGVTYVRRDGLKASRLRLLWRSLVAWSPVVGAMVLAGSAMNTKSLSLALLSALPVMILAVWSLWLPERGLPDRLAGTWPVPR